MLLMMIVVHDNDQIQSITLDQDEHDRVIIWKIRTDCYLICVINVQVDAAEYTTELENALDMIEQSKY